jgi:hypothetical protein
MPIRTLLMLTCAAAALGQPAPKAAPDTLALNDGEMLIGHFVRSAGDNVVFKSEGLGELTIAWSKVKELHAGDRYVVIDKGVKLTRHTDVAALPKGTVEATAQAVKVHETAGATPKQVPVPDAAYVVDETTFQNVLFHNPGFFQAWKGVVTGGASIVQATQQARTFTGSIALNRTVPLEGWVGPRNRTLVDFSGSEGFVTQPGVPRVKTSIVHADAEHDEYFRKDLYVFGLTAFDHNYSQGLDLQASAGGGIGYTVIDRPNETLDFKSSAVDINQSFQDPGKDHNLFGSNFIESFSHKTAHSILFLQQIAATPTWTELENYTLTGSASVSIPVFRRLGFTMGVVDSFLNNPAPGFKKNSFQFTTGLTYTLR